MSLHYVTGQLGNTDRMLSFLNAAKKVSKKLAISLKHAYLLGQLSKCTDTLAPRLDDENIELYASRKAGAYRR